MSVGAGPNLSGGLWLNGTSARSGGVGNSPDPDAPVLLGSSRDLCAHHCGDSGNGHCNCSGGDCPPPPSNSGNCAQTVIPLDGGVVVSGLNCYLTATGVTIASDCNGAAFAYNGDSSVQNPSHSVFVVRSGVGTMCTTPPTTKQYTGNSADAPCFASSLPIDVTPA